MAGHPPKLILALDTATDRPSVAVLRVGPAQGAVEVLAESTEALPGSQAHRLLRLAEDVLSEAGAGPGDLGGIVVGTGPGTFTGVRLGVAAARAAALSLAIPVVGVTTLSALAAEAAVGQETMAGPRSVLVPLTDARRGEVFGAVYARPEGGANATWRRAGELFVCPPDAVAEEIALRAGEVPADDVLVAGSFGSAAGGPSPGIQAASLRAAFLLLGQDRLSEPGELPEGDRLAPWFLAIGKGGPPVGSPGSPEGVAPVYVRAADADAHITKMRDPWA